MKTVLFCPGFMEGIDSRDYRKVLNAIELKGYKPEFVPITWKYRNINDWVSELGDTYGNHKLSETILAGFSFGAMTAFCMAAEQCPSELWLFSLSPYFSEDLKSLKYEPVVGQRRFRAFSGIHFDKLAKRVNCKVLLFAGDIECRKYPSLKNRAILASRKLIKSELRMIPHARHDITQVEYLSAVMEII